MGRWAAVIVTVPSHSAGKETETGEGVSDLINVVKTHMSSAHTASSYPRNNPRTQNLMAHGQVWTLELWWIASPVPGSFACFVTGDKVWPVLTPEMHHDGEGDAGMDLLAFSLLALSAVAFSFHYASSL